MTNKLPLYFDTIKRIPIKQNIFLVKEKIFKKVMPIKLLSLEEIERNLYSEDLWITFLKNAKRLRGEKSSKAYWDYGNFENKSQQYYKDFVKSTLVEYQETNKISCIEKFWNTTHKDIEFIYNIQRMYLFNETMISLDYTNSQKISVVNSWIDRNPPKRNEAWMGFNCSIRLINWVKILTSLKNINSIKVEEIKKIFLSILQNLKFIEKNIEHHIPGNHIIFQFFALWLVTFLISDEREEHYSKLFENEFSNEFLESGLHFELSTHYHIQVLQLGVYYILINDNQKPITIELLNKIKKAYYVLDSFSFSKNNLPLIGDNCYNFFHDNLVEDSENLNGLRKLLKIEEKNHSEINEIKNEYLISTKNKFKIIFDVGNIGLLQNPGHGHSDLLSINISYNGIPIFIDPGTKRYSNLAEDLEFKKARSHNTISINGEDQAKLWGFFRWAFLPDSTIYKHRKFDDSVILEANFMGFKNIGGAKHSRKIEIKNSEIIISDSVECSRLKSIEQNFFLSEFVIFKEEYNKYYLNFGNYKFEFIVESEEHFLLEVFQKKIYKIYDHPIDSNNIRIIYNPQSTIINTKIRLRLIGE